VGVGGNSANVVFNPFTGQWMALPASLLDMVQSWGTPAGPSR